jgi:acyl-coenzyme A synthetase/AMP-(fatty) acid ligase
MNIMGFARKEMGPAVAPKEIEFIESIPKTQWKSFKTIAKSERTWIT